MVFHEGQLHPIRGIKAMLRELRRQPGTLARDNLKEKPWNPLQLTDGQTEELVRGLIDSLNKYPEMNFTWTCSGDTLIAVDRQRLNGHEVPIFFVCTIRKCLMAKHTVASTPGLMGTFRLGRVSAAGGIFINAE